MYTVRRVYWELSASSLAFGAFRLIICIASLCGGTVYMFLSVREQRRLAKRFAISRLFLLQWNENSIYILVVNAFNNSPIERKAPFTLYKRKSKQSIRVYIRKPINSLSRSLPHIQFGSICIRAIKREHKTRIVSSEILSKPRWQWYPNVYNIYKEFIIIILHQRLSYSPSIKHWAILEIEIVIQMGNCLFAYCSAKPGEPVRGVYNQL